MAFFRETVRLSLAVVGGDCMAVIDTQKNLIMQTGRRLVGTDRCITYSRNNTIQKILISFTLSLMLILIPVSSYAFDFFSYVGLVEKAYSAYEKVKSLVSPDPSFQELLDKAKGDIINRVNIKTAEVQYDVAIGRIEGLIDEYPICSKDPLKFSDICGPWINDAFQDIGYLSLIIEKEDPDSAVYVAPAFNTLVPMLATVLQAYEVSPDIINSLFKRAFETNHILLGEPCFFNTAGFPCHRKYKSKIYRKFNPENIDPIRWIDPPEFFDTYQAIWQANEYIRSQLFFPMFSRWFQIERFQKVAQSSQCLYPDSHSYGYEVTLKDCINREDEIETSLWQFVFDQYNKITAIRHWSGKCLTPGRPYFVIERCSNVVESLVWDYFDRTPEGTIAIAVDQEYNPRIHGYRPFYMEETIDIPSLRERLQYKYVDPLEFFSLNQEGSCGEQCSFLWRINQIKADNERIISTPKIGNNRLDWCRWWATGCGKEAADAFCKSKGYVDAVAWKIDDNIGDQQPTQIIETGQICNQRPCDGFKFIECE